ncbi:uncharacterized protein LOC119688522 [Teleopsis dalmanni]|uniref:uncharacterized protein LOC119688522 n=1 Tax=Teleopsis dalmanni TaxID=139649 RepID=UPI0018CFDB56|nr:uncharacterized protein LOC119688522 [Teleopsis dalmanni]
MTVLSEVKSNNIGMEHQRSQLLLISISLLYLFRATADCWKFDGGGLAGNSKFGTGHGASARLPRSLAGARGPPPAVPGNSGSFAAILSAQQQDMLYACPLNSMCQCAGLPNETSTLIEINCNEVALYKFPEFIHSSVRYIEMSHTHLQTVDDETFQGLRLKTLKLIDNELQDISERSFSKDLPVLQHGTSVHPDTDTIANPHSPRMNMFKNVCKS